MWLTSKKTKKAKHDEMLKMARIYVDSNSIDEFLIAVDLQNFKHISSSKWRNPFAIYGVLNKHVVNKHVELRLAMSIGFLALMLGCMVAACWTCDNYPLVQALAAMLQAIVFFIQSYIDNKDTDARHAMHELKMAQIDSEINSMLHILHANLKIPLNAFAQTSQLASNQQSNSQV